MRLTRDDWIEAAMQMLARQRIDGVRVEVLARRLGVTKGSFYWHFEDRDKLLEAMIDAWEEETDQLLAAAGEKPPGLGRVRRLLELVSESFGHLPDASVFAWALRDPVIARRVAAVDKKRIDFQMQAALDSGMSRSKAERNITLGYLAYCGWVTREEVAPDTAPSFRVLSKWLEELFEIPAPSNAAGKSYRGSAKPGSGGG